MKLKLTNSQMGALCMFLNGIVLQYQQLMLHNQLNMQEKLYKAIFEELSLMFQKKWLVKQDKYTIRLKPYQAIAWHLKLNAEADVTTQHGLLCQQISDAAHKQYF